MDVGRRASFAAGDLKNAELKRLAMRYSDYVEAEVEDDEISFYPQQSFQPKATSSRPLNLTVSKSKKNITPYQAIRGVVSKNKVRFQEDGFDLDLTYISPQMIAMGFPSSGTEGYYRNQIEEVERFFDKRHRNHYKVYNLCSERTYDTTARFGGNHARYGFDDHNPPVPISIIPMFVKDAQSYLAENPANVIAVHCKAGKGRTGVMLGALMITQSWQEAPPESPDGETVGRLTAADALARFGNARTHDGKGVTIPSQIRYIRYWEDVLRSGGHIPGPRIMKIDVFRIISTVKDKVPTDLYFTINMLHNNGDEREKREVYDSRRDFSSKSAFCNNSFVFDLSTLRHPPTLQGDVLFRVRKSKVIGSDDNLFHFWLNIDIEGCKGEKRLAINLEKNDLDKAVKDKSHETYKEDLAVELRLSSVANRGHAHSALSPQLTSTRNSHLSMTSFFQSPPLVAQISPLLPIEPTTREGSPIGRVGRRSSSPHVYPQLHASFGHSTIKEFNGWLRLQKLHVQRLTVHGLDAPLEAFLKVIVDDVERDTEKKKMSDTGETLAWGPQEVFSISSVTAPHLEFELYVQQRARVQKGAELLGCASIRLTDMLPDVLSWSKHAKSIDTLQNLWSIGLELENDDEATIGLLRIEGAFELPSRVPRGRPEHCVVLAASIAMCCCTRNRRQSWFSPESSVLGTLVDSPCPSSPLGIDSPKRGFASPDGDVSRRPPKTRKKYKPQQAYVGTTQFYPPSGPSKVQGIQLSGTFFTRSEELDAIDLSLVDSFPVASGEKGIRLEGLGEFQLRSTLERNAWLEVLEAAVVGEEPPPLTLGESAITAVEQALLLLESNERAARAELRVEVAQSFSLLRQRHANFSLAQMNRECAALATYARRLAAAQELARKHELERRKARNADHGQTSSRSGSDLSLPVWYAFFHLTMVKTYETLDIILAKSIPCSTCSPALMALAP
ncbi:Phosphatidylinositol 3 [Diplonema papillatum]|nr:Phosphatidylinositol 3 [Diplonema papillatum]